jgi:selenocysteine lyase/cysteine desulfurase
VAVPAAIDFQAAHDGDAVRERCHALATLAARELAELDLEPLPESDDQFVQMIAFRMPPCEAEQVTLRLAHEHRIEVLAQTWRGQPTLRLSFQGYNDERDLDALAGALATLL